MGGTDQSALNLPLADQERISIKKPLSNVENGFQLNIIKNDRFPALALPRSGSKGVFSAFQQLESTPNSDCSIPKIKLLVFKFK